VRSVGVCPEPSIAARLEGHLRTAGADQRRIIEIRTLGPLEVVAAGDPVEVPSGKARLLLAALVVHANQVVSTDRLFEFLWRGQPPDSAANTLQTYVSHLRRSLEPERTPRQLSRLVITREPGYLLAVDRDQIDAGRFERLVEEARLVLGSAPEEAAALLRTALSLWRGEPLADFTFEPFAQSVITRLTELRLTALEDRVEAELALGRHAALCGELAQLAHEHPLRERLSGQLMVALYRCGRQAEALRAYADLRATLLEQLGIDPSPALGRLQAAILQQDPELDWPRASKAPALVLGPPATVEDVQAGRSVEAVLASARSAVRLCRWQEAFNLFSAADERGGLTGEDLDALAEVAFWLGRPHESHAARQRAHGRFLAEGQPRRAAMTAIVLSVNFGARRRFSVAGGWYQRAHRLLAEEPDGPEHGFLAWAATMFALATGDHDRALQAARRAFDLGRRFAIPDLQALGLVFQGYILVREGDVDQGLLLMDEGMTWAVDGQLAPTSSAVIFCRTIDTCYALGDYRRASEWMDAIADCFARTGIDAFPGDCEAHGVGILIGRGAWSEGERRARRACADMEPIDLTHVGLALAEIGEIRWRRGDLAGAETAFARAVQLGSTPPAGMALVRLAQGDVRGADASITAALADETWDCLARARLLPAQVEIALAGGDVETASSAAAELAVSTSPPASAISTWAGSSRARARQSQVSSARAAVIEASAPRTSPCASRTSAMPAGGVDPSWTARANAVSAPARSPLRHRISPISARARPTWVRSMGSMSAHARRARRSPSDQAPRPMRIPTPCASQSPGKASIPVRAKQSAIASIHSEARR
jgi:DNA-binding SARP family transcriptional activator